MSVNGLDSPTIIEAYQGTLADPGGWFLLQYKSRDELAVQNRGTGGWLELRAALDTYDEKSPLYGFFLYRRRKLILKYIPEETSRLLQVRTTVHYPAILDHFSPHDAEFAASAPGDLNDVALSAACSLHTEASLSSSEKSPRRHNLDEITEDTEEPQSSNPEVTSILARLKANKESLLREQRESLSKDAVAERYGEHEEPSYHLTHPTAGAGGAPLLSAFDKSMHPRIEVKAPDANRSLLEKRFLDDLRSGQTSPTMSRRELRDARSKKKSEVVHNARSESPHLYPRTSRKTGDNLRADLFDSRKNVSNVRADIYDPRRNAENMRTALHEPPPSFYELRPGTSDSKYSFLTWKPKVKLFPRPAGEGALKRPVTENSARQKLPSGMRIALNRGAQKLPKAERPSKASVTPPRSPKATELSEESTITPIAVKASYTKPENNGVLAMVDLVPKRVPIPDLEKPPTLANAQARADESMNAVMQTAVLAPKSSQSSIKKASVAPEKQRLLKALQQRNKQLNKDSTGLAPNLNAETKATVEAAQTVSEDDALKADSGVEFEGAGAKAGTQEVIVSMDYSSREQQKDIPTVNDLLLAQTGRGAGTVNPIKTATANAASENLPTTDHAKKRKTLVKPINTSPHLGDESDGFASDDSLMDELQHATVEHARRVSIPGLGTESNPVSPTYSGSDGNRVLASARPIVYQNGSISSAQGPGVEPIVTAQGLTPSSPTPSGKPAAAKRNNAPSGFSRRIKALAEISNREQGYHSSYGQASGSTPMQRAVQSSSVSQHSKMSATGSRDIAASQSVRQLYHPDVNTQSLSITARIVQPSGKNNQERAPSRGGSGMDLQQSEVTVQRETDMRAKSPTKTSFFRVDRPPSSAARPDTGESSLSSRTKRSTEHGFNFLGLRKGSDAKPPQSRSRRSPSIATLETVDENADDEPKPKKAGLFKRMSGFASAATRKVPAGSNGSKLTAQRPGTGDARSGFVVGDLNVQFPDTLLWKRRWVEVEHNGFLTLNSTNQTERTRLPPRRYHMSELKPPIVASQDGQELPFSILVDLISGGTLQFACEDPISQAQVLRRLSDTHRAWMLYGP